MKKFIFFLGGGGGGWLFSFFLGCLLVSVARFERSQPKVSNESTNKTVLKSRFNFVVWQFASSYGSSWILMALCWTLNNGFVVDLLLLRTHVQELQGVGQSHRQRTRGVEPKSEEESQEGSSWTIRQEEDTSKISQRDCSFRHSK